MSEDLVARLKRHDGFCSVPRPDNEFKGNSMVVGFGHDLTESCARQYANGISEQEAVYLLYADIGKARAEMLKDLPWTADLSQSRQDVLTELVFWIGIGGLLGFKDFLSRLRSGDAAGAAHALLDSLLHRQIPGRTEELANILLDGDSTPAA